MVLTMEMNYFETVYHNLYNGIYIVDGRGVTIDVNRTFEEMSGFSREELIGRNLYDLVGKDKHFSGAASLLVLEQKRPITATYTTSTNRKLLVRGKPILDNHGLVEMVINTVWDLTTIQYSQSVDADTARCQLLNDTDIITCNEKTIAAIDMALRAAETDSTIVLNGESGVGKSLLVKTIHRSSPRKNNPLVQINCAALPENLIEAELFGYEAGSFTGANRQGRPGLLEMADGGTVFLDEISELPLHLQSKLLGVIQDKEFFKVGGRQVKQVDVRLITATNADLENLVNLGLFGADLFYRLNVVPITLPPLRDRREDIPHLISFFLDKYNRKYRRYKTFSDQLVDELVNMPWKGNIRELENVVERSVVTIAEDIIDTDNIRIPHMEKSLQHGIGLKQLLAEREREILIQAQAKYHTTRRVADVLQISQPSAARKLKALKEVQSL